MSEELENKTATEEVVEQSPVGPMTVDDGVIKVNLAELNKPTEETPAEQEPVSEEAPVEQINEEVKEVEEVTETIEQPIIQEITEEEVVEQTEELEDQVEQALIEADAGIELPENIQKVVEFMNETGGSLSDYVKLNTDYTSLSETQLLREYY